MCALMTVMCAGLVLLQPCASSAAATSGLQNVQQCVQQCLLRCHDQFGPVSCCNCQPLCDKTCRMYIKTKSADINGIEPSSAVPCGSLTPCPRSELLEEAWKRMALSCVACTKRRKLRSPSLREATLIARSVGIELGGLGAEVDGRESSDERIAGEDPKVDPSWRLHLEETMSIDQDTLACRVSWEPAPGNTSYLVTWEVEGGALRGNLLTNSSSSSLSLWPDTVYHIQVTATSTGVSSSCLEVNTNSRPPGRALYSLRGAETLTGAAAAAVLLIFLAVLLLLARRCRDKPSLAAKEGRQIRDLDHFKLYPPPITIRCSPAVSTQTQVLTV